MDRPTTFARIFDESIAIGRGDFDCVMATMFRGTLLRRDDIRRFLTRFNKPGILTEPMSEEELEHTVDRVRVYQKMYHDMRDSGCIGVGLIFNIPDRPFSPTAEAFLKTDRGTGS